MYTETLKRSYFTVRDGDNITLLCDNDTGDQEKCHETYWALNKPHYTEPLELVKSGQIQKSLITRSKSERLSVTQDCSLLVEKVTEEDAGHYLCSQQGGYSVVHLSVVTSECFHHNDSTSLTV